MLYKINEKKSINIPDEEIEKSMKILELTKEEAIQMWLDDNNYTTNEVVETLTKQAKENQSALIGARANAENKKTERPKKDNPVKKEIINLLKNALKDYKNLQINNIKVENDTKIIIFSIDNREFKLDLIEKRIKK